MTAMQYRAAIEKLGLSQQGAARFLGVGERTSRRWALDEVRVPESVAMLLRLMIRLKLKPEDVR
jgi:DNA-binding transcriptional regulator YiaG